MRMFGWRAVLLCASGCAGAAPPAAEAAPVPAESSPSEVAVAAPAPASPIALPAHTLARSAIHAALAQGLGAFLQHVELDDRPVLMGGKFHGFRIAALHDAAFWNGVDLKAGDVVTSVNGFPIERPEQAQTAFDALDVASELRVSYDREGQPRELVFAIADGK